MKNSGFTYIEMVCVLTVVTIIICVAIFLVSPKFSHTKKNTFIDNANSITKAAINKYTNDGMDDENGYPDDIYHDKHKGRVCYNLKVLKDKYIKKIGDKYQGSVEICYSPDCTYKTKLWLSNDEYYISGAEDHISSKKLTDKVLGINRCGE